MTGRRAANHSLRALLSVADWTLEALARSVNALGAENGTPLHYDRTSVAHWLAGSLPRPRTRELIAEAFTRRLRRPVSLSELGMTGESVPRLPSLSPPVPGPDGERGDAVGELAALCAADADPGRRHLVHQSLYSATRLGSCPPAGPESATGDGNVPGEGGARPARHTAADADDGEGGEDEGLGPAVDFFHRAGEFGGRHARTALVVYLHDDVVPRLHRAPSGSAFRSLSAHAARLVLVLARMYVDDVKNGAAQLYHRVALRLASAAGDGATCAGVLAAMSRHAGELRHHEAGMRLAEAAVRAVPDGAAGLRAVALCQLALARARFGDRDRAAESLAAAAPRTGGRPVAATCVEGPPCAAPDACLMYHRGQALAALGDRAGAVAALRAASERWPQAAHLSRALTLARLGGLLRERGHLEQSCAVWHRFLDDHLHLRSGRADRLLSGLRGDLRVHAAHPRAGALLRRADEAAGRAR